MKGLQLPLGVQLADRANLDNYFSGPNHEAVTALRALARPGATATLYLYGAPGSGKSHLLQGLTAMAAAGGTAAYLPLRQFADEAPDVTEGMEQLDVVCIDDLEAIIGHPVWMLALLRLLDRLRSHGARCVVAAGAAPERLGLGLTDLVTRLHAATVYGLRPLNDADLQQLLQDRAAERGLQLAEDAGRRLLAQLPRDTGSLIAVLDSLDRDSLRAQRRLSLPFITQWLRDNAPPPGPEE